MLCQWKSIEILEMNIKDDKVSLFSRRSPTGGTTSGAEDTV
jgi:hypothetical protein